MRILFISIVISIAFFSCKEKDQDTNVIPTPQDQDNDSYASTSIDSFSGLLIIRDHTSSTIEDDTFTNSRLHLTTYGDDSIVRSSIRVPDNNFSVNWMLPVSNVLTTSTYKHRTTYIDSITNGNIYTFSANDSVYFEFIRHIEPGTNFYFYGTR